MPGSFLLIDTDEPDNCDISSSSNLFVQSTVHNEEQQDNYRSIISSTKTTNSFVALLKRLCIYYRRILFNKIRLLCTVIFMSMLNIATRITCFVRQRTSSTPSTSASSINNSLTSTSASSINNSLTSTSASSINNSLTSTSRRTLEEDLIDSSKSLLLIDKTSSQSIDLQSITKLEMAHLLVQQQTHRTPNINIHSPTSTKQDSKLPMVHSVDDRLFLHDSTHLLNLLTRFASEPQMSKYHSTSTTYTNGHFSKSPDVQTYSEHLTTFYVPVTEPDDDEIHLEDIFYLNCDKIQPVSSSSTTTITSSNDDFHSDKIDDLTPIISSEQLTTINNEEKSLQLEEDTLIDLSSFVHSTNTNNQETHGERHFRRRKRRSSLTRNSVSSDDNQLTVDLLDKLELTPASTRTTTETTTTITPTENEENLEVKAKDNEQETQKTSDNQQTTTSETNLEEEKSASVSRYRGRRLRHRFYRHAASTASSPTSVDISPTNPPHFYLVDEALDVEPPKILSPVTNISPPPSPISPTLTTNSTPSPSSPTTTKSSSSTGGIKRIGSVGTTKKNVRFADSVGRELTQVQYIRSSIVDESQELSFLLGSTLLSSSPPSLFKNSLYVPKTSGFEHKPWSFDVALTTTKPKSDTPIPRRFFCLFRQPNSEHPDIYLHEIWKSQIKLEYADIPLQVSSTGEQQLHGSLWVTNAGYSKYVSVKYTFNRWLNTYEYEAQHRYHSNDFRNIDKFEFTITIPVDVDRIDFVLRYCVNGQEHWDNNNGNNYTLQTESAYIPSTTISLPHDCDFNEMRFY